MNARHSQAIGHLTASVPVDATNCGRDHATYFDATRQREAILRHTCFEKERVRDFDSM